MMGEHALLSASSAYRWLKCTPSPMLEQQFMDQSSAFAEEGTAAHALAEYKLKKLLKQDCELPQSHLHNEEMERCTDEYVEYAAELISGAKAVSKDPLILIEQRLDFSNYVPQGFGTCDLVIVSDSILEICDLKYGKGVQVSAEDNPQMKLYALGALNLFDRPGIVDKDVNPIFDQGEVYSGCYGRASIVFYAFNQNGNSLALGFAVLVY